MARIEFEARDKNGFMVRIVTSEGEMKDLVANYEKLVGTIQKDGFTLSRGRGRTEKELIKFDGKKCPVCGSPVFDNRQKKQEGTFKPNAPDFTCSNRACTGGKGKDGQTRPFAVWSGQYEIVDSP